MKKHALFLVIFFPLLFYGHYSLADGYTSPSYFSEDIAYCSYMILANGMPIGETAGDKSSGGRESEEPGKPVEAKQGVDDEEEYAEEVEAVADPLESFNRAMFKFNDKLYFGVLKPVARGYRAILPEEVRISVRRFFSNAATPVRLINCALQGKVKGIGVEPARFLINTTIGVCGFFDPAKAFCNMKAQEVDFDQTLGRYGMEPMMYINWPILGPSSVRGTLGLIGDTGFDPSTYLISPLIKVGISSYEGVNETSLTIGEYEDLKESALDPYIAVRDAYFQNRESKLKEQ
jgi:phospholipid-binding lipoprotein MlaA